MRQRILSSVDFPAPFRPMMPITSPGSTTKLTSSRTRSISPWFALSPSSRESGFLKALTSASRRVGLTLDNPRTRYCLLRLLTLRMGFIRLALKNVDKVLLPAAEGIDPIVKRNQGHGRGNSDAGPIKSTAKQSSTNTFHDP